MAWEIPYEPVEETKRLCIEECNEDNTMTAAERQRCIEECSFWNKN